MERKAGTATVAVTKEEVRSALSRAKTLTSDEEKALRMRHGIGAQSLSAPLPRAAGANAELADELLIIEMQLLRASKLRQQQKAARTTTTAVAAPKSSRAKDKIVRALRKKK